MLIDASLIRLSQKDKEGREEGREEEEVDLDKVIEIIELYNYLPVRVKIDKNKSNDLYYQMLSNKKSSFLTSSKPQDLE